MNTTLRCAIVGPTGYTGLHLVDRLLRHPQAEITYLASHREALPDLRDEFPVLRGRLDEDIALCRPIDVEAIAREADVVFLALPHTTSFGLVPRLLDADLRVIDLSADYRLEDPDRYEAVYGVAHGDRANLPSAVYGIPELFRNALGGAVLVANPGCYPTAAALAVAPLLHHGLAKPEGMVIHAASGVSGAGRKPKAGLHFPEVFGAYGPYGQLGGHRHQTEIAQTLSRLAGTDVQPLFIPHLLPVEVGILETITLDPHDPDVSSAELREAYRDAYANEPFIRLVDRMPNIKHVAGTNYVDLYVDLVDTSQSPGGRGDGSGQSKKIVAFAAEDNLIKGASGQAIQNMNAVFGLDETLGLR